MLFFTVYSLGIERKGRPVQAAGSPKSQRVLDTSPHRRGVVMEDGEERGCCFPRYFPTAYGMERREGRCMAGKGLQAGSKSMPTETRCGFDVSQAAGSPRRIVR